MKKSATLAAAFILCVSQAWAYDNPYAGYSLRDGNPFCKVVSSRHYAYSGFGAQPIDELEKIGESCVHLVNYYTADEMEQIIGEKFSTAYFAKQYEQMALLQRAQLDMRTVPSPLVDMERYVSYNNNDNLALQIQRQFFQEQSGKVKPLLSLGKVNGYKTIKLSYLYKQADDIVALDVNLLSANDRLYVLSTVKKLLPKQDNPAEKASADNKAKDNEVQPEIGRILDALLHIEKISVSDVDQQALIGFHKEHSKFLKAFKATTPAKNRQPLSFTDSTARKSITLPQDWFYSQIQLREESGSGTVTIAASLPVIQKIAAEFDYEGVFAVLKIADADEGKNEKTQAIPADEQDANNLLEQEPFQTQQVQDKAAEEARKALQNFDAMLLTCSIKPKGKYFKQTLSISLDTELTVREALQRLQGYKSDYFALPKYSYDIGYKNGQAAYIDVYANITLLKDFSFDNHLSLANGSDDVSSLLFYLHKSDITPDEQITQGIRNWQI